MPGWLGNALKNLNHIHLNSCCTEKKVEKKFRSIDTLVVNAGIFHLLPIEAVSEKKFDETMNVNFKGAFFTLQKFLPLLKSGSSVILFWH